MVEFKFILEVARHGARAPSELYPLTAPGQANFPEAMQLTDLGANQHYSLGQYVGSTYFQGKDLSTMSSAGVYAESTDKTRTRQSATSQLQGLFGADLTYPDLDPETFPLKLDHSRLILTESDNCKRFAQLTADVDQSPEWQTLFNWYLPDTYLNSNLYDWLREETGYADYDLLEMSDVATYVNIAAYHGMELEFPVSKEHFQWTQVASDQFTYDWLAASPEFWQLAMQDLLTMLDEAVDVVFNKKDLGEKSVISANLEWESMPYFWLLLGHQETLWPLTAALGFERMAKLPFSGAYFFEFFTFEGVEYVLTKFRDDTGHVQEVRLDCSLKDPFRSGQTEVCEKDAFQAFIRGRLELAKQVDCDSSYPEGDHVYKDIKTYTDELLSDIGLPSAPQSQFWKRSSEGDDELIELALLDLWSFSMAKILVEPTILLMTSYLIAYHAF